MLRAVRILRRARRLDRAAQKMLNGPNEKRRKAVVGNDAFRWPDDDGIASGNFEQILAETLDGQSRALRPLPYVAAICEELNQELPCADGDHVKRGNSKNIHRMIQKNRIRKRLVRKA